MQAPDVQPIIFQATSVLLAEPIVTCNKRSCQEWHQHQQQNQPQQHAAPTSFDSSILRLVALMSDRSAPISSGALASAHSAKWERCCAGVSPPTPTCARPCRCTRQRETAAVLNGVADLFVCQLGERCCIISEMLASVHLPVLSGSHDGVSMHRAS